MVSGSASPFDQFKALGADTSEIMFYKAHGTWLVERLGTVV